MTAYLAGLAILRCAEHDRSAEFDSTMRLTLAAMASFAGSESEPVCIASQATIADRAGLRRTAVKMALPRLEKLGAIERAGKGPSPGGKRATVRYRLTMLDKSYGRETTIRGTWSRDDHKEGSRDDHKEGSRDDHKSSEGQPKVRPKDRSESGGERSAFPPPSLIAVVAGGLGLSDARAVEWIMGKLDGRDVRNPEKYIRACLEHEPATVELDIPHMTPLGEIEVVIMEDE